MENSKWKQVLFNEVTFIMAICSMAVGICIYVNDHDNASAKDIAVLQTEVSSIKGNHLPHIQASLDGLSSDMRKVMTDVASIRATLDK